MHFFCVVVHNRLFPNHLCSRNVFFLIFFVLIFALICVLCFVVISWLTKEQIVFLLCWMNWIPQSKMWPFITLYWTNMESFLKLPLIRICPWNYQKIKTTIGTCWLLLLKPFNEFIGILLSLSHLDVIWRISIHHNKLKTTINFSLEINHNNHKGWYNPFFVNLLSERCNSVYMK